MPCTQSPQPCSRPLPTHTSSRDSWTLAGKSVPVSCGVTAPFSWFLLHPRFVCALQVCFPSPVQVLVILFWLIFHWIIGKIAKIKAKKNSFKVISSCYQYSFLIHFPFSHYFSCNLVLCQFLEQTLSRHSQTFTHMVPITGILAFTSRTN